jgi:hypothetical protein
VKWDPFEAERKRERERERERGKRDGRYSPKISVDFGFRLRYGRPTKGSFVHANPQVPSLERGFVATGSFVLSWGEEEVLFEAKAVNEVDAERSQCIDV